MNKEKDQYYRNVAYTNDTLEQTKVRLARVREKLAKLKEKVEKTRLSQ